jgi:UPF0042 nucleotide-binding protein
VDFRESGFMGENNVKRLIILTGLSGSGKSTALRVLEDQGFYPIDNLPPSLLPQLLDVLSSHPSASSVGVVAVMDVRGKHLLNDLDRVVTGLKRAGKTHVQLIFLDASDREIASRFQLTKRAHPINPEGDLLEGISEERAMLVPLRGIADMVIDTSGMNHTMLRKVLLEELLGGEGFKLIITSFGFKYGIPQDSDVVWDVRFLPNPNYVPHLKDLTGMDRAIVDYFGDVPDFFDFVRQMSDMLKRFSPCYERSGKVVLRVSIGCTGGRHRSVAVAEAIGDLVSQMGLRCEVLHRDVDKGSLD